MGKYYLVGNFNNNNKIENETYYKEYKSITDLDKYTSLHNRYELLEEMSRNKPNTKLNNIEVRYFNNKANKNWYSMPIITNDTNFYKTANNTVNNKRTNYKTYIQYLDPNLYEERYKFKSLLLNKNKEVLDLIYPDTNYDHNFKNMINNYLQHPSDEELNRIDKEFSRYKNYRRWITSKDKLKNNYEYRKNVLEFNEKIYNDTITRDYLENMFSSIYKEENFKHRRR